MNEQSCLKIIALCGLHLLAVVYDSQWLTVAIGLDCAILGYELKNNGTGKAA